MQEVYGIAAFRSRQQVLMLESALRRQGLSVGVITTPRDVALGCGLSVRFQMQDLEKVRRAVAAQRPTNLVGIYQVNASVSGRGRLTSGQLFGKLIFVFRRRGGGKALDRAAFEIV